MRADLDEAWGFLSSENVRSLRFELLLLDTTPFVNGADSYNGSRVVSSLAVSKGRDTDELLSTVKSSMLDDDSLGEGASPRIAVVGRNGEGKDCLMIDLYEGYAVIRVGSRYMEFGISNELEGLIQNLLAADRLRRKISKSKEK